MCVLGHANITISTFIRTEISEIPFACLNDVGWLCIRQCFNLGLSFSKYTHVRQ